VPLIDGGTQRLPRVIGLGPALDMILTGRAVDAEEAQRIGLVTAVVGPGEHLERSLELAERLAAFPQETMLSDRRAAIEGAGLPLADGLRLEHRLGREVLEVAARGAARFAAGEGRHGDGL
jgi:enoyl-CoA hydratase